MLLNPIFFALVVQTVVANIAFNHVELSCNASSAHHTGCLRGQMCMEDGSCKALFEDPFAPSSSPSGVISNTTLSSSQSAHVLESRQEEPVMGPPAGGPEAGGAATPDGSCGRANDGMVCGNWYQGPCCSMYGFCGNTASHCGDGCQSGPCIGGVKAQAPGPQAAPVNGNPGSFRVVGQSGVPAMHAGLLPNGRVVFLDKIENYSQLKLANGQWAYSSEWDPATNNVVPLGYKTNAFCAGGTFLADGRFVSFGGNAPLDFIDPTVGDGFDGIRYVSRSSHDASLNGQDWQEPGNKLASRRWYATAQTLGDGRVFVASGSLNGLDPTKEENNNPTYEMLNRDAVSDGHNINLDLLVKNQPYYMYPFVHLLRDGTLFIFVAKSAQIFSIGANAPVKALPDLPGDYRTYPNTGTSVLLPLTSRNNWEPDVVICGGGAYQDITSPTDASCGRIKPFNKDPKWEMESMPEGRGMVEGTLLPDGTVIFLNGCSQGAQGFNIARTPALEALIYDPAKPVGKRFSKGAISNIPRLYHSVALLLLDGTLMVTGSNPVEQPKLVADEGTPFVTEFRIEIYTPPYLQGAAKNRRPTNIELSSKKLKAVKGSSFTLTFDVSRNTKQLQIALYHGGFVTHSLHMGARMMFLDITGWAPGKNKQSIEAHIPDNKNVAPPGPYVVYVVVDGVPGIGQFVQVE